MSTTSGATATGVGGTIRIAFQDSANCGGSNSSVQTGGANQYVLVPPGGATLNIRIQTHGEMQSSDYDKGQVKVDGEVVAELASVGQGLLCQMETKLEDFTYELTEGSHYVELFATTGDGQYHQNAYVEFTITGLEALTANLCEYSPSPTPSPSPFRVPFPCCGAQAVLSGGYAGFTLPSTLHVAFEGITSFLGNANCYVSPDNVNRSEAFTMTWDGSGFSGGGIAPCPLYVNGVRTEVDRSFFLRFACEKVGSTYRFTDSYMLVDGIRFDESCSIGQTFWCAPFRYRACFCRSYGAVPPPPALCNCWIFDVTE